MAWWILDPRQRTGDRTEFRLHARGLGGGGPEHYPGPMPAIAPMPRSARVLAVIGSGHALSHFYLLALPPLFPLIKAEFAISYAELGLLLTLFNVATAAAQVPAGFLTDRIGARALLLAGLALMAGAIGLLGASDTYGLMLALVVLAGIGNSVVHPTDYVIMSGSIEPHWLARAFSIHTFAGNLGFTVAPITMIALAALAGWRGALMLAGLFAVPVLAALAVFGRDLQNRARSRPKPGGAAPTPVSSRRLLLSAPILLLLLFYMLMAMVTSGVQSFSVTALVTVHKIDLGAATTVLTAFLIASSAGILLGGLLADRTRRYALLSVLAFGGAGLLLLLPGLVALPAIALTLLFALAGLLQGSVRPARDMMVRAVTPEGAVGRVFAFVMTGLNVGAAITPFLFGLILDLGEPQLLFWLLATFFALAVIVVLAVQQVSARTPALSTPSGEVAAE
jgi:MFS transporter, FSR family, fosmidomycin resistance protein